MFIATKMAVAEVCERVKKLGYGAGSQVRLYGEKLEVLSDPFPEENGIAIKVRAKGDKAERVILLPATVLQSVQEKRAITNA